jgi:hypothetical protein
MVEYCSQEGCKTMLEGEVFALEKVQILSQPLQENWNISPDPLRDKEYEAKKSGSITRRGGEMDEYNLHGNICHAAVSKSPSISTSTIALIFSADKEEIVPGFTNPVAWQDMV